MMDRARFARMENRDLSHRSQRPESRSCWPPRRYHSFNCPVTSSLSRTPPPQLTLQRVVPDSERRSGADAANAAVSRSQLGHVLFLLLMYGLQVSPRLSQKPLALVTWYCAKLGAGAWREESKNWANISL
ncbi:hypothetical protein NDU88_002478 [Pleurodeles waltl]|uniref:Uncharacterized protein n=1 Tax=Pleurodeles waltl TaxID=8319 RepID=A0AAV7WLC5_PLEWA|nr:hypothetical protein NDU88_002478 [Pleurodeles waltl]